MVLLTAFYVDNGPQLPLWQLLPIWTLWVLPAAIGTPVLAATLRRYGTRGGFTPARPGLRDNAVPRSPPADTETR